MHQRQTQPGECLWTTRTLNRLHDRLASYTIVREPVVCSIPSLQRECRNQLLLQRKLAVDKRLHPL